MVINSITKKSGDLTRIISFPARRCAFLVLVSALILSESGRSVAGSSSKIRQSLSAERYRLDLVRLRDAINRRDYGQSVIRGKLLLSQAPAAEPELIVRARKLLGAAQLATGQYRDALETLLPARALAIQIRDAQDLVSLNNSIAWIYLKMDRVNVAAFFADRALDAARATGKDDIRLFVLRALIYAKQRDFEHSDRLFAQVINQSLDANDLAVAATAWYLQGRGYTEASRLPEAESALTESFRLRKLHHLPDLEVSMRDLAEVQARRGNLRTSPVLIDEAVAAMGNPKSTADTWGFLLTRGRIRMLRGELPGALEDLRSALSLARRLDVIPTDDDRITFESGLAELYSLFIDCGNRLYLQNRDPRLKAEVFEAAEENRAASLRALVPQRHDWRTNVPPEHEAVLEGLQTAERSLLTQPTPNGEAKVRMLRARLDEIEFRSQSSYQEPPQAALPAAERAAGDDAAILSFHLGEQRSWVWLVERKRFEAFALPGRPELASDAHRFRDSIRNNTAEIQISDELGQKLLGGLPPDVFRKHRWILALDGELFDLPFAALRWNGRYLVQDHSLLVTPGIQLLEPANSTSNIHGSLTALADPVYNQADPRWRKRNGLEFHASNTWRLARLTGSGQEAKLSVQHWGTGNALVGLDATKSNYLRAAAANPAILHLATHVVPAAWDDPAGMIVFGLNSRGEPDFLGMRDILLRPSKVKLVVMSGCSSGDAKALPANGLMGLTRAWLGAGVEDVLATRWASIDDNGPFFAAFYDVLRSDPKGGPAEALRLAQVEMIRSHSFRESPQYWASYFLTGKL